MSLTFRRISLSAILAASIIALGCAEKKHAAGRTSLVREFSAGPVSATLTVRPAVVELHRDVLVQLEITAPSEIDVDMPELDGRFNGLSLSGMFDEQPYHDNGKTTYNRKARLTPELALEFRIAPIPISYTDRSKSPPKNSWFHTAPIVLEQIDPIDGPPPDDITAAFDPFWIRPTAKSVGVALFLVVAVTGILAGLLLLSKRVRRKIQLLRLTPRERALAELAELVNRDLIATRKLKVFYLALTMIVRRYIERQHTIRAPEQTTEEFLQAVSVDSRFSKTVIEKLATFLAAADLVKFARYQPGSDVAEESAQTAREYIEEDGRGRSDT